MGTREEATEARERLAEAVEKLADSDSFCAWLRAHATFRSYSFGNVCLIVSSGRTLPRSPDFGPGKPLEEM